MPHTGAETRPEDRFRRLIEVGRGVLSELNIEVVLRSVAEAAREATGARYAALGVLDERKENLERFIHVGIDVETAKAIGDLPRGRGVLGELIRHPEPLRLADVSSHPHSYGFPAGHPSMRTFLGVPVRIRGEAFGNLYATEKARGEEFTRDDEEAMTILASWAAIAIENARLYTGLATRQEQLQRALRQVETTVAITKAVGGETDLERVLELIVKRARALIEAQALAVFLAEEDDLVVAAAVGRGKDSLSGLRQPRVGSPVGVALTGQQAHRLSGSPVDDLRAVVGAEVAMLVPLVFRGRSVGVLAAFDRVVGGPDFDAEDQRLLGSFATSAATAVATAQTVEEGRLRERVEAAERERHHWAHELHDEALQQLAAIRLDLVGALRGVPPEAGPLGDATRRAVDRLEREIGNLSRLINELRPLPLETLGLSRALESLVEEAGEGSGLSVDARVDLPGELSADAERAVYRLVQEALNNVVKHSGAGNVRVAATQSNGRVDLLVADDGAGFDTGGIHAGVGLRGMRERVEVLGGGLEISSGPGTGTEVRAWIPVSR